MVRPIESIELYVYGFLLKPLIKLKFSYLQSDVLVSNLVEFMRIAICKKTNVCFFFNKKRLSNWRLVCDSARVNS